MGAIFPRLLAGRASSCAETHVVFRLFAVAAVAWPLLSAPAQARGPDGIADVAEKVIEAHRKETAGQSSEH